MPTGGVAVVEASHEEGTQMIRIYTDFSGLFLRLCRLIQHIVRKIKKANFVHIQCQVLLIRIILIDYYLQTRLIFF